MGKRTYKRIIFRHTHNISGERMKVSIHNYQVGRHEIIDIPDDTEDVEIETELSKLGYSLSNIEYMVIPNDDIVTLANIQRSNL